MYPLMLSGFSLLFPRSTMGLDSNQTNLSEKTRKGVYQNIVWLKLLLCTPQDVGPSDFIMVKFQRFQPLAYL